MSKIAPERNLAEVTYSGKAIYMLNVKWLFCKFKMLKISPEHSPDFPLYALKEFAAHLLGLHAPAAEPGFGFCQQHLEFPSCLPSMYYPDLMLLNFRVRMGTGISNMARSTDLA